MKTLGMVQMTLDEAFAWANGIGLYVPNKRPMDTINAARRDAREPEIEIILDHQALPKALERAGMSVPPRHAPVPPPPPTMQFLQPDPPTTKEDWERRPLDIQRLPIMKPYESPMMRQEPVEPAVLIEKIERTLAEKMDHFQDQPAAPAVVAKLGEVANEAMADVIDDLVLSDRSSTTEPFTASVTLQSGDGLKTVVFDIGSAAECDAEYASQSADDASHEADVHPEDAISFRDILMPGMTVEPMSMADGVAAIAADIYAQDGAQEPEPETQVIPPAVGIGPQLREILLAELADVRSGKSDPRRAMAIAKLAAQVVASVRMEIEQRRLPPSRHPEIEG